MRSGRWARAVIGALTLAVVPGAAKLVALSDEVEPGAPVLEHAFWDVRSATRDGVEPAPPAPAAPVPAEVAITPPPAELKGAPAPAPPPASSFRIRQEPANVLALIIGIDDYPGRAYDLEFAGSDAATVDEALARFGIPTGDRMLLLDGQATRPALLAAVGALAERAGPSTTVVLSYAGHVRKLDRDTEAIVTAEGDLVTDAELAQLLAPARAPRMWFLFASCYAGGMTELLAPGRILTGAADASSLAYENPDLGGSYLVHHLVREGWLEGRAGPSEQEAYRYADEALARSRPDRRPVQFDQLGVPLRLDRSGQTPPPPSGSQPPPPAPSSPSSTTTTTAPPEESCIVILCRRS